MRHQSNCLYFIFRKKAQFSKEYYEKKENIEKKILDKKIADYEVQKYGEKLNIDLEEENNSELSDKYNTEEDYIKKIEYYNNLKEVLLLSNNIEKSEKNCKKICRSN